MGLGNSNGNAVNVNGRDIFADFPPEDWLSNFGLGEIDKRLQKNLKKSKLELAIKSLSPALGPAQANRELKEQISKAIRETVNNRAELFKVEGIYSDSSIDEWAEEVKTLARSKLIEPLADLPAEEQLDIAEERTVEFGNKVIEFFKNIGGWLKKWWWVLLIIFLIIIFIILLPFIIRIFILIRNGLGSLKEVKT